jgi:branched-chain amino acid transport system permease protein
MVFIGGLGTLVGPILGAAVIVLLPNGIERLSGAFAGIPQVADWLSLHEATVANGIYGLLLLLVLLFERDGIYGLVRRLGSAAAGQWHRHVRRGVGQ